MDWEELKTKWLEALRSGHYKQTRSRLRKLDGYCCLGVLCDITGKGEWEKGEEQDTYVYQIPGFSSEELMTMAPHVWFDGWTGKTDDDSFPCLWEDYEEQLAELNDEGHTFEQIADIIEQWLRPADAPGH